MDPNGEKTVFEKIIDGEIPSEILMEDERCIVIRDINPCAPTHVLIIPRKRIPRIGDAESQDESILGHLLLTAKAFAKKYNLNQGFRIVINNGPDALETVPHLHLHLLGGKLMAWPPC
ncbi:MAG: HIT domain-containing protein [Puniceicoccales bacterium]|jgi:histidine triad (HIT) family protein|nr:HIT domain-containing protein [Puniceicoccales bacterium]